MKHTFKDTATGSVVTGEVNEIVTKVMKFREKRGIPADRGHIYNEVLGAIQKKNVKVGKVKRRVRFRDALAAGKAAVKIVTGDTVDQKEMQRRWDICRGCPALSETSECFSCNRARFVAELTGTVKSIFGKEIKYPGESKKYTCGVCGCTLALLLPTRSDGFHEDSEEEKKHRPDFCWINKESHNFIK